MKLDFSGPEWAEARKAAEELVRMLPEEDRPKLFAWLKERQERRARGENV